eukprot:365708-Chlamydomonas_euryale.AAC.13
MQPLLEEAEFQQQIVNMYGQSADVLAAQRNAAQGPPAAPAVTTGQLCVPHTGPLRMSTSGMRPWQPRDI